MPTTLEGWCLFYRGIIQDYATGNHTLDELMRPVRGARIIESAQHSFDLQRQRQSRWLSWSNSSGDMRSYADRYLLMTSTTGLVASCTETMPCSRRDCPFCIVDRTKRWTKRVVDQLGTHNVHYVTLIIGVTRLSPIKARRWAKNKLRALTKRMQAIHSGWSHRLVLSWEPVDLDVVSGPGSGKATLCRALSVRDGLSGVVWCLHAHGFMVAWGNTGRLDREGLATIWRTLMLGNQFRVSDGVNIKRQGQYAWRWQVGPNGGRGRLWFDMHWLHGTASCDMDWFQWDRYGRSL